MIILTLTIIITTTLVGLAIVERNSRYARPRTSHHATPCARLGCCDATKIETPLHAGASER